MADGAAHVSRGVKTTSARQRVNKTLYRSQWRRTTEYIGHRDGVLDVNTAPWNTSCFATCSLDRTARIWVLNANPFVYSYCGHRGAASGDRTLHLWRVPALTLRTVAQIAKASTVGPGVQVPSLAAATLRGPDLGGDGDGGAGNGSETAQPDGDSLHDGQSSVSMEATSLTGRTPLLKLAGHTDAVTAADWLADGRRIVSGSWDQTLQVWDVSEGTAQVTRSMTGHEGRINNVVTHPTQPLVLSAARDGTFRLWDVRRSSPLVNVARGHVGSVRSAVFTKVGTYVVSSAEDDTVKVWDLKYMKAPTTIIRQRIGVNRLAVSPTVATIAAPCDNGDIVLTDLSGGIVANIARSPTTHSKAIMAVAWTPDEAHLLSCGFPEDTFSWAPV